MSEIIKPEDVSQSTLELAMERFKQAYWNQVTPQNVADFLQDCIEAGVVSPPCHCLRLNGELQMAHFTDNPKVFAGKPWSQDTEHYKGQTE